MTEMEEKKNRYFWAGWFDGQSFALLATIFAIFSFVDLFATIRTMDAGMVKEGNSIAAYVLTQFGQAGFVAYKTLMVMLIIGATWLVDHSNPRLARGVLWGGILLMAFLAILHIAILISGMTYPVLQNPSH